MKLQKGGKQGILPMASIACFATSDNSKNGASGSTNDSTVFSVSYTSYQGARSNTVRILVAGTYEYTFSAVSRGAQGGGYGSATVNGSGVSLSSYGVLQMNSGDGFSVSATAGTYYGGSCISAVKIA